MKLNEKWNLKNGFIKFFYFFQVSCLYQSDVVFVIDNSGLLDQTKYNQILYFVAAAIMGLPIDLKRIRVGVITYSDDASIVIPLNNQYKQSDMAQIVATLPYAGYNANTAKALRLLRSSDILGNLRQNMSVPAIAVVITNGVSVNQTDTIAEAWNCQQAGFTILTVSVGSWRNDYVLSKLASYPYWLNNFTANTASDLTSIWTNLANALCNSKEIFNYNQCWVHELYNRHHHSSSVLDGSDNKNCSNKF